MSNRIGIPAVIASWLSRWPLTLLCAVIVAADASALTVPSYAPPSVPAIFGTCPAGQHLVPSPSLGAVCKR